MTATSLQVLNHVVALTGGHVGENYDRQGKKMPMYNWTGSGNFALHRVINDHYYLAGCQKLSYNVHGA